MELNKLVVASGNEHKNKEIKEIFTGVEIIPMKDLGFDGEINEDGESFLENAVIKAKFIAEKFSVPALADDSGLCVEALGGRPGIFSARYSGGGDKENRALLLKELEGVENRKAYFECGVCLFCPDRIYYLAEGRTYGRILTEESGENGFGYDSLFYSDELKKSFASATAEEKNSVSHRYRALCDLWKQL